MNDSLDGMLLYTKLCIISIGYIKSCWPIAKQNRVRQNNQTVGSDKERKSPEKLEQPPKKQHVRSLAAAMGMWQYID